MSDYTVTEATEWEPIDQIARELGKCIPGGAPNHEKAKRTWDIFYEQGQVKYFLVAKEVEGVGQRTCGYVRLFMVSPPTTPKDQQAWTVDYVCPSSFRSVIKVAEALEGTVMAKLFTAGDSDMVADCPKLYVGWPRLDMFPYHVQGSGESSYVVIVPALAKVEA